MKPHIDELLQLKAQYQQLNGGVPFDPPVTKSKKKKSKKQDESKDAQEAKDAGEGEGGEENKVTKKQLNKEKKKAARQKAKDDRRAREAEEGKQEQTEKEQSQEEVKSAELASSSLESLVSYDTSMMEWDGTQAKVLVTESEASMTFKLLQAFDFSSLVNIVVLPPVSEDSNAMSQQSTSPVLFMPTSWCSSLSAPTVMSGDMTVASLLILQTLNASCGTTHSAATVGLCNMFLERMYSLLLLGRNGAASSAHSQAVASFLSFLDHHFTSFTYALGHVLSPLDALVCHVLHNIDSSLVVVHSNASNRSSHISSSSLTAFSRWLRHVLFTLHYPSPFPQVKSQRKGGQHQGKEEEKAGDANKSLVHPGCPPLKGAIDGQVCTRFPPEPSGYLHVGHVKALLLNEHYARRYHGTLILRFDDTNPSKEKEEFEQNILFDIASLGITPDKITHTSDSFDIIIEYARQMIRDGHAFMDDTKQEDMQEERIQRVNSKHRDMDVETTMELFDQLLEGAASSWCLRAKIDMTSDNGCMRDPVLFRANDTPHNKTGTRYKAYPTYDFACPIVDSIEGVTHALRTTEYNDRDFQYQWLQEAMGLRTVNIRAFSRISFIYTLMSKRKLNWFVENRLVDGWFDPRFPTVQGLLRRGVSIQALREFILSQGASRRVVNMEWDVFWAANKRELEIAAKRTMGLPQQEAVVLNVLNFQAVTSCDDSSTVVLKRIQNHPKDVSYGYRPLRLSNKVLIEQGDAEKLEVGKQIVLLRWGGFTIQSIIKDRSTGKILHIDAVLDDSVNLKKAAKLSWLADTEDKVSFVCQEFGHLITKPKLEPEDDFMDFVNTKSMATTLYWGDASLRNAKKGDVVQLERRGFFRVDQTHIRECEDEEHTSPSLTLILIPDGKTKAMSTLSSALGHL